MNRNSEYQERSPWELGLFAINFVGFVLAAAGTTTSTGGVAVTGVVLLAFGLSMFLLRHWLAR